MSECIDEDGVGIYVVRLILISLLILACLSWFPHTLGNLVDAVRLSDSPSAATGRIVDIYDTYDWRDRPQYRLLYVFRAGDGSVHTNSQKAAGLPRYEIRDRVRIEYLQGKPHINQIAGTNDSPAVAASFLAFAVNAIAFLFTVMLWRNEWSKLSASRRKASPIPYLP